MVKKVEPVLEFEFQSIKLDQVADLVPAKYRSRYEAIRQQVIAKIKSMPGDESFLFAPAKNSKGPKLDENLIARICSGINVGLVREQLNWKIAFSDKAKAFVVTPYRRYKIKHRSVQNGNGNGSSSPQPKKLNGVEETTQTQRLLKLTHALFGVSLKDLQVKLNGSKKQNPELSTTKKAFVYVGHNECQLKVTHLANLLGLAPPSTSTLIKRARREPHVMERVQLLTNAVHERN